MANQGSVPSPSSSRSRSILFVWDSRSSRRFVHRWPLSGTYWRSSSQIGHSGGGASVAANWTPQVAQMKCVMSRMLAVAGGT